MNKRIAIIVIIFSGLLLHLVSCKPTDTIPPKIYLLNKEGKILKSNQKDTSVWLYCKYEDPGVLVEDNVSKTSDIIVENDIDEVLSFTKSGYLKRTEAPAVITYTATDKQGLQSKIERNVFVKNIADFLDGRYTTKRAPTQQMKGNEYFSNIGSDNRIPGRIRFSKVYLHKEGEKNVYYRVMADLYSASKQGQPSSPEIGFMGGSNGVGIPFFDGMDIETGLEAIRKYNLIHIHAQEYSEETDESGEGTNKVYIAGINGADGLPLSRIEYINDSDIIDKIVLELNITRNGVVDRVVEIYIPE